MAKRKRLGPVDAFAATPAPETKSAASRPPIAAVAGEAAATQALAEVSGVLETARAEGRLVQKLPLSQIVADHLIRDRLVAEADEMAALKDSLIRRGQQTPIEVVDLGEERYGLISGWRRLNALLDLAQEGGTETVLARIITPDNQADAYVAMVEENEIRVGLTYYERARIVVRAVKAGVYPNRKKALQGLFANVSRAKRSKIGSFVDVVEALDGKLRFPTAIGERLGLQMAKALQDAGTADRLRAALRHGLSTPEMEQAAIAAVLAPPKSVPAPKDVRELPGLSLTNAGINSKGPLVIEGEALTPLLRDVIFSFLRAELGRR